MKKIICLFSAFLLIGMLGYSQDVTTDKVPAQVSAAFAKKFPAATEVKYVMVKKNYAANFKDKEAEMTASFSPTGRWIDTKTKIAETDLPKKVAKSIKKNFKGFTMSNLVTVETVSVKLCYEMEMKDDKQGYTVQLSPKGDVLRKIPLKKEKTEKPAAEKK